MDHLSDFLSLGTAAADAALEADSALSFTAARARREFGAALTLALKVGGIQVPALADAVKMPAWRLTQLRYGREAPTRKEVFTLWTALVGHAARSSRPSSAS